MSWGNHLGGFLREGDPKDLGPHEGLDGKRVTDRFGAQGNVRTVGLK